LPKSNHKYLLSKNTLYITFDGLSDPLGQSQILPYITGIAAQGYQISILSCEKLEKLEKQKNLVQQQLSAYNIHWKYLVYSEDGNWTSRIQYIRRLKQMAVAIVNQQSICLIHCRSYLSALIGLHFKRKHGIPFIFDMRGFWADERIDGHIWSKRNPLHLMFYWYFKRKEKQFLKHSEAIVSLTEQAAQYIQNQYAELQTNKKISVIPCSVNTALFKPLDDTKAKEIKHQAGFVANDEVLVYSGSIGTWYYTNEMLDCVAAWNQENPNIKLLVLTKDERAFRQILSAYPKEVEQWIRVLNLSYHQVPDYLSIASAAIFFIKPAFSKIASSPTKMAECWAMNLPVITNIGIGDNDYFIVQKSGGVLVNDFNKNQYLASYRAYKQIKANGVNYRSIAIQYFDLNLAVKRYINIYHSLCNL